MIHSASSVQLPCVLQPRFVCLLLCLLLGGALLSGCRPGGQGSTNGGINELDGMVTLSASDVWAVGFATTGQGISPLVEHWNGHAWSLVSAPGKGKKSALGSVAARTAQDVWAVGSYWQGAAQETLIEHWNGSSWHIVASPNGPGNNYLGSVAVVSATDVWAVGTTAPCPQPPALALREPGNALDRGYPPSRTSECADQAHPLIEHWDGHAWSIVPSPSPDPTDAGLSTVVAFDQEDVWASGSYFHLGVTPADGAALFEHWDGTVWSIRADFDVAMGGRMWATAFLSSNDIWGAEYATAGPEGKPTIKHWDGNTWNVVAGPSFASVGYYVGAMTASAPDDLWAVGNHSPSQQRSGQEQVFTMHWDGTTWSLVNCPSPNAYPTAGTLPGGNITLTASISRSPDDAWMAGYYYPSNNTQLTFIEHWDGRVWRLVPNPNPAEPASAGL